MVRVSRVTVVMFSGGRKGDVVVCVNISIGRRGNSSRSIYQVSTVTEVVLISRYMVWAVKKADGVSGIV